MNKKLVNIIGIGVLAMFVISFILLFFKVVEAQYLDKAITLTGCVIGLVMFIMIRKEKKKETKE